MPNRYLCNSYSPILISLFIIVLAILVAPIALAQPTYSVLYSFSGGADGRNPFAGLTIDAQGNLYGTASYGGIQRCGQYPIGCGVVFKLDAAGHYTVLHAFANPMEGYWPVAGLAMDAAGTLYGTTPYGGMCIAGGPPCAGTVFRLDRAGNYKVLHVFTGKADGNYPQAGVFLDAAGNLYGTTVFGGLTFCGLGGGSTCGVVYKLDPAGHETVLRNLISVEGMQPFDSPVMDAAGNLYGTTAFGGAPYFNGVAFKLDPAGHYTMLHTFTGGADGSGPHPGLMLDAAGNLYGGAGGGGDLSCNHPYGCGVVYKLDPSGHETVLHTFTGADGAGPSGVVLDGAGNLYGTTGGGGTYGWGVVFKLDPAGNETVLYSFTGGTDGQQPASGVVLDAAGNLYGTAIYGGTYGPGVVFKITMH